MDQAKNTQWRDAGKIMHSAGSMVPAKGCAAAHSILSAASERGCRARSSVNRTQGRASARGGLPVGAMPFLATLPLKSTQASEARKEENLWGTFRTGLLC
eukprot:1144312-Pelagomonas_calceolata.AAC.5